MSHLTITATPLLNGALLPNFNLRGLDDQLIALSDIRGLKGTVVAFIHGTWCPYCIRQLIRLNRAAPDLYQLGCGLVCIAHDPVETISAYQHTAQPSLAYPLLADSDPSLAHTFGIYDPDHGSPYPAVFYATANDIILYSNVSSDPDCFPNMQRLVEVARAGTNNIDSD